MKYCCGCKVNHHNTAFSSSMLKKRWGAKCIESVRVYNKQHYADNKEIYKERIYSYNQRIRNELQTIIDKAKEDAKCPDCGFTGHSCQFDFDHLDKKLFSISQAQTLRCRKELLLAEIDKCELVCANCHRLRTLKKTKPL